MFSRLRLFLSAPAEKISSVERRPTRRHDGHEHVSVVAVHDQSFGVIAERYVIRPSALLFSQRTSLHVPTRAL
jgi:hypothetical protein